ILPERDVAARVVNDLEPAQELEVVAAGVAERPVYTRAAGEKVVPEPAEVGDALPRRKLGEDFRVEHVGARRAAGASAHQGRRVDMFPCQELWPATCGEPYDSFDRIQGEWRELREKDRVERIGLDRLHAPHFSKPALVLGRRLGLVA